MPLDYSKWDNIEISDDEDIEVHPNVDKRSFIKWNQEAIHQRRAERRSKIKQLQERIQINERVIEQIGNILEGLDHTDPSNIFQSF
ncbi:hsp90 co-chaperone Cdc37 [Entomophthora muscae]|uniref:Hsp90 co-chaperone Cdc37 n=1 Tax=Entomophthora muscae TaxID=34485 RepID=A0ACC2RJR7_9FUNG|nr:hsp90 co-chaperone Cdc37 [Entomophthora muscae]